MANHKSAKKRSKQALKRNKVNRSLLSKIKNNVNIFHSLVSSKKSDEIKTLFYKSLKSEKNTEDVSEGEKGKNRVINSFRNSKH